MTITKELEDRIRERGVRIEERLGLLRALTEEGGEGEREVRRRLAELEQRIRETARAMRGALR